MIINEKNGIIISCDEKGFIEYWGINNNLNNNNNFNNNNLIENNNNENYFPVNNISYK